MTTEFSTLPTSTFAALPVVDVGDAALAGEGPPVVAVPEEFCPVGLLL